ncbi:hypothetical protein PQQ88_31215, partial [Paraburkholderia caledonica]
AISGFEGLQQWDNAGQLAGQSIRGRQYGRRRVGHPNDIGASVAWLLADSLGWTNGMRMEASGGMFL